MNYSGKIFAAVAALVLGCPNLSAQEPNPQDTTAAATTAFPEDAPMLRNDGAPALATLGVLSGGIFNVFGDWFFVFPCDMGVYGAGLATALGSAVSFLVMLTHFASRKNTLRLVKPKRLDAKAA